MDLIVSNSKLSHIVVNFRNDVYVVLLVLKGKNFPENAWHPKKKSSVLVERTCNWMFALFWQYIVGFSVLIKSKIPSGLLLKCTDILTGESFWCIILWFQQFYSYLHLFYCCICTLDKNLFFFLVHFHWYFFFIQVTLSTQLLLRIIYLTICFMNKLVSFFAVFIWYMTNINRTETILFVNVQRLAYTHTCR